MSSRPTGVTLVFVLVGVALLALGGWFGWRAWQVSTAWPRIPAAGLATRVAADGRGTQYGEVHLGWRAGGAERDAWIRSRAGSSDAALAAAWLAGFPVGDSVRVALDPADPSGIVADPDDRTGAWLPTIVCGLLGLTFMIFPPWLVGVLDRLDATSREAARPASGPGSAPREAEAPPAARPSPADHTPAEAGGTTAARIVGVVFLAVAVVLAVAGGVWYDARRATTRWPVVDAVVTRVEVVTAARGNDRRLWNSLTEYRYRVGGRELVVQVAGPFASADRAAVEQRVRERPVGSRVRIRHDPAVPERIETALSPTLSYYSGPLVLAGMALLFGGLGAMATFVFARRPGGAQAPR
ncbi:MAG: DUF3592 domain-containing protein [Gemmatimonadales bacterium]|nr:DUF3592 domain-containing protein [Gemmatimonadales bacterium]